MFDIFKKNPISPPIEEIPLTIHSLVKELLHSYHVDYIRAAIRSVSASASFAQVSRNVRVTIIPNKYIFTHFPPGHIKKMTISSEYYPHVNEYRCTMEFSLAAGFHIYAIKEILDEMDLQMRNVNN